MAQVRVGARRGEGMRLLRLVERIPGSGKQSKASEDDNVAEQVERVQMRITFPAHKRFPEVPRVVREQVDTRERTAKPPGKQVDGQGEAVHLGKECHDESRECAKGTPIAACARVREAEREDDEHPRVDDHQQPEAIGGDARIHCCPPSWGCCWFGPSDGGPPCPLCPPCIMKSIINGHKRNSAKGKNPRTDRKSVV